MSQNNASTQNSKRPFAKDKKKTERKTKKTPKKITESYLHNSGLYYLQRFASSSGNFRQVMTRKIDKSCHAHKEQDREHCLELLERLIEKYLELGLLNDEEYTRGAVISLRRRGLSSRAIHAKLAAKKVPQNLIKETLSEHDGDDQRQAELYAALKMACKKRLRPFNPDKDTEKSLAALARYGFSYDVAKQVIEYDRDEAEKVIYSLC